VIEGGKVRYENGHIRVPTTPGLGVRLDRQRLAKYEALFGELGPYPYDQDPGRPGWTPLVPNDRWADPWSDAEPFVKRD
jgi:glucarate dehydratase